ncbi:hypothetical protein BC830DRAFT_590094 [Chytriomyces sp. MP71]|nr:hypothetical protein BC830DRAFT_590094 [Chytriomyces sp. MP71]
MSTTGLVCSIRWTDLTFSTKVTATAAGFLFLVSLLFMAYAYARIYHRVRKVFTLFNTLHGVSEEGKMTVQARMRASSETTMTAASKSKVRQRVLLVQSVVIVALFVCCWTPYVAVAIIGLVKGTQTVDSGEPDIEFVFFAEMMMLMHAVLNPIVVCVFDQDLLKVIVVRGSGQVYRPLRPLISPPTLFPHGNVHC